MLTEECIKQVLIIKKLSLINNEFSALYTRIALYINSLRKAENIDQLEFGRNDRHKNNRLSGNYFYVAQRDLDLFHRMAYFDKANNAVIVTTLGHYNIELLKSRCLFDSYADQIDKVKKMTPGEFGNLKINSQPLVNHLVSIANRKFIRYESK